ncbi:MAG: aldo/keto reductase, partial [Oscillospiraceae bacterium]|nr:aldo/keto reductase [Oscillospiraceae bacterium]
AGTKGLKAAAAKGLPVIIMEPLLGGKLANVPKKAVEIFKKAEITPVNAALKWLWEKKEVTVVLSGMSSVKQLEENIKYSNDTAPLTPTQHKAIIETEKIFKQSYKVPCTGCNYCTPCPNKVNIPGCFAAYNASYANGLITGYQQYITSTSALNSKNSLASNCTSCKLCEQKCPQHIQISKELKKVTHRFFLVSIVFRK